MYEGATIQATCCHGTLSTPIGGGNISIYNKDSQMSGGGGITIIQQLLTPMFGFLSKEDPSTKCILSLLTIETVWILFILKNT